MMRIARKNCWKVSGIFFLMCCLCSSAAVAEDLNRVTVCYEPAPGTLKDDPHIANSNFFNYIVSEAFVQIGIKVSFDLEHTFKSCLLLAQQGRVDFVSGAYYDQERAKIFDYSDHYYTLTPQIFYTTSHPVSITQVSDLKKYRGCGIYGSSYSHYGLVQNDLDLGPGYESMFNKLLARRCDYFVEELEVVYEMGPKGRSFLDSQAITHADVSGARAPSRYLITRKNSLASQLLPKFNQALIVVINSPKAKELWNRDHNGVVYKK